MAEDKDALNELRNVSNVDALHWVEHYLYFPDKQSGKKVANILRGRGFDVEDRLGADDVNWLVLAKSRIVPTEAAIEELRETLEQIAEEHGGEYDGWEAEVEKK